MTRMTAIVALALACVVANTGWTQTNQDLANENAELKNRVENLERQVQALAGGATEAGTATADAAAKKPVWSNLDIQFYGFIKGDASYDSSSAYPGNYVVWTDSEANNNNDDKFNLTANETRLGFKVNGPKGKSMQTSGQVEFDFYGSPAPENKAKIQMRHAFLTMAWPESDFSILAGQTWDVISPLNPSTLNYTVLWDAGNIGYRRPQIRLTKEMLWTPPMRLKFEGAISRTIGRNPVNVTSKETGEDAGFPTVQGRVGLQFPWLAAGTTSMGVSGHYGQEEYDLDNTGRDRHFDSWSINFDILQPITKWMTLKAEIFSGENLDSYFGGIGQGVRAVRSTTPPIRTISHDREIGSAGGWCAASLGPWNKWQFNVGLGIDDVDADDVNPGDRTLNRSVFGNAVYAMNKNTDVGFELSHWKTDYKGTSDGDDVRLQASFKYKF